MSTDLRATGIPGSPATSRGGVSLDRAAPGLDGCDRVRAGEQITKAGGIDARNRPHDATHGHRVGRVDGPGGIGTLETFHELIYLMDTTGRARRRGPEPWMVGRRAVWGHSAGRAR